MHQTLTEEDRDIQRRARTLVEQDLIPYEREAEMGEGSLPPEVEERQRIRVKELGLAAINFPKNQGGQGMSTLQQVLVFEQIGRVTNGLGWVVHTPPAWIAKVATDYQLETWILPAVRSERRECYAITEEDAGSDINAIQATARRKGAPSWTAPRGDAVGYGQYSPRHAADACGAAS